MTIDEIRELIQVVHDTGIAELEVQRGDNRVRIRRNLGPSHQEIAVTGVAPATSLSGAVPSPAATAAQAAKEKEEERHVAVKSPIVGTYYDSPSPSAPPFVKVGDMVEPKQVLCIIESMKLMNEIEAETAGIVVAKLIQNGRPVEYGEALFTIQPR